MNKQQRKKKISCRLPPSKQANKKIQKKKKKEQNGIHFEVRAFWVKAFCAIYFNLSMLMEYETVFSYGIMY